MYSYVFAIVTFALLIQARGQLSQEATSASCHDIGFTCGCGSMPACNAVVMATGQLTTLNLTDGDLGRYYTLTNDSTQPTITAFSLSGKIYSTASMFKATTPSPNGEYKPFCSSRTVQRKVCEDACAGTNSSGCTGDAKYCKSRVCLPEEMSPCKCVSVKVTDEWFLWKSGRQQRPDAVLTGHIVSKTPQLTNSGRRLLGESSSSEFSGNTSTECSFSFPVSQNYAYNFTVSCDGPSAVRVQIGSWVEAHDILKGGMWTVRIPDDILTGYTIATLMYYDLARMRFITLSAPAPIRPVCFETAGVFEWDTIENFKCQSVWKKTIVVSSAILAGAASIVTVLILNSCLKAVICMLKCMGFMLGCTCCFRFRPIEYIKGKWSSVMERARYARIQSTPLESISSPVSSPQGAQDWARSPGEMSQSAMSTQKITDRAESSLYEEKRDLKREAEVRSKRILEQMRSQSYAIAGAKKPSLGFSMIAVLAMSSLVHAEELSGCTRGHLYHTDMSTCTSRPDGSLYCEVEQDIEISIPYQGGKGCYTFADDNQNLVLGTLTVEYLALEHEIQLAQQYFTNTWSGVGYSIQRCHNAGNCPSGCSSMSPNDVSVSGELSHPVIRNNPGVSGCAAGCGCAGCGCFYCTSSCLFHRSVIQADPMVTPSLVMEPSTHTFRPMVRIQLHDQSGELMYTRTATLEVNTELDIGGDESEDLPQGLFKYRASQISGIPTEGIHPFSVVVTGANAYLGMASRVGEPSKGLVGDIQGNTYQSVLNGQGSDSFIFSKDVITTSVLGREVSFSFAAPGLNSSKLHPSMKLLPTALNGNVWTFGSDAIYAQEAHPASLSMTLSTLSPIRFSRVVTAVCPVVTFVSAAGCYSCSQGAMIKVKAKSGCQSGPAIISFLRGGLVDSRISMSEHSIMVTPVEAEYIIHFQTATKGDLSGQIEFSASSSSTVDYSLTTVSGVVVPSEGNSTVVVNSESAKGNWWDDISDYFGDFWTGSFWDKLVSTLYVVAGVAAVLLFIVAVKWAYDGASALRATKAVKSV